MPQALKNLTFNTEWITGLEVKGLSPPATCPTPGGCEDQLLLAVVVEALPGLVPMICRPDCLAFDSALAAVVRDHSSPLVQKHPELVAQIVPSPFTLKWDTTIKKLLAAGTIGDVLAVTVKAPGGPINPDRPIQWREQYHFSGMNTMTMVRLHWRMAGQQRPHRAAGLSRSSALENESLAVCLPSV